MPELLRGAQQLVVLLAHLDRALLGDQVDVQAEALDLLQRTLNDSGTDGSGMFSDLTIDS